MRWLIVVSIAAYGGCGRVGFDVGGGPTCDGDNITCNGPECRLDCCNANVCSNDTCSGALVCAMKLSPCP